METIVNEPVLQSLDENRLLDKTEAEKSIWYRIRFGQLSGITFLRQYRIGPYDIDFYSPRLKLAVELICGMQDMSCKEDSDIVRTAYLEAKGVDRIAFSFHDALNIPDDVVKKLVERISTRTIGDTVQ